MSVEHHRAHGTRAVACAILTVSDTRTPETDTSGARTRELLIAAGHRVVDQAILPDEPVQVRAYVEALLGHAGVDAILVNGGTGLAPRDTTYEAVAGLLEKRLDGFGELFRMLSFQEIGAAAMLSRAVAGVARGKVVASMPGSTAAVELAMAKLLVPELGHMVKLAQG
ncbi:MAG: MogA/MoaB family molybdenum cofactor biosynthesis protein [Candidatus Binatia bacterium]